LKRHDVIRTGELRWQGLENGELLTAAEQAGFDVLVTCVQNIQYQQSFTGRKLAVVILSTNHWPCLRPVAVRIASAVDFVQRGKVMTIDLAELRGK